MQYKIMIALAAILALLSALMTAFGMTDLFKAAGMFILILFITIDLGRFLLFNFVVNEWTNLRKVKYIIVLILILLFGYSAVGVFSKLDSLVTPETKQAMLNAAIYNKSNSNAKVKQDRSEDLAKIAEEEYRSALDWNRNDLQNCIARARGNKNAENKCNNTKRVLDMKASAALKEALGKADETLDIVEEKNKVTVENQGNIATVLSTICKLTQKSCDTYDNLQNALTILIFLVIIGTDYLQIAIILAVNTRKNKKSKDDDKIEKLVPEVKKQELNYEKIITHNSIVEIPLDKEKDTEKIEDIKEEIKITNENNDLTKKEVTNTTKNRKLRKKIKFNLTPKFFSPKPS